MHKSSLLPVLSLRDMVLLPRIFSQVFVGRHSSINAIKAAQNQDKQNIIIVTQKDPNIENVTFDDLYKIGVLAKIIEVTLNNNNMLKVLVQPSDKIRIIPVQDQKEEFLKATYEVIEDQPSLKNKNLLHLKSEFFKFSQINKNISYDIITSVMNSDNSSYVVNLIANNISNEVSFKQKFLEIVVIENQIKLLIKMIINNMEAILLEEEIDDKIKKEIQKNQREYLLNEKLKVIQKELILSSGKNSDEFSVLEEKINKLGLSKEAKQKGLFELNKLKTINPLSTESSIIRSYLDILVSLPWSKKSKVEINLEKAQNILDQNHYGLSKIKDRITEYLAILKRTQNIKGSIICLYGPPGVGKTSLVRSIADSIGKKYCKFSLGGIKDEAEIRGHRKTYLGAMPGKIISLINKVGFNNPVFLLDEIDKMSSDYRGDPASAILEVLDPEQNKEFQDNYLEVSYDLSNVTFIATANSLNFPAPLRDRMEIINISGYIEDEKIEIAKSHLIPKLLKEHGMKDNEFNISEDAILDIIRYYTMESGVRSLEREIANLLRKSLKEILSNNKISSIAVNKQNLSHYLGVKKFLYQEAQKDDKIGICHGLAYTEVGGKLLIIESIKVPGEGKIKGTGKLGEVMKESLEIAYGYFCSTISWYGITKEEIAKYNINFHFPEGAVPKDGPSAGVAIFMTILSLITNIPIKQSVAMTGEITLQGKILPIGGLREKLLAAARGNIKTVFIPQENEKDLVDIPNTIKDKLSIISLSYLQDGIKHILSRPLKCSGNY